MKPNKKLVRRQLDSTLDEFKKLSSISTPHKGWIRAIRDALGITGPQLARRMGLSKQRVSKLEQTEVNGGTTLKTMSQAAEALNCKFVYSIVPHESLENTVRKQAKLLAEERLKRAHQTMTLEGQELSKSELQDALDDLVEDLISNSQSSLWDENYDV